MSPEQAIYRANRAKEVVENEAYIEAFEAIEQELTEQWKQSPARDQDAREKIWVMLKMLQKVKISLESTMDSGKLATKELEHRQTLVERAKDWLG